ncbi:MAG TPA: hypothetical protein VN580_09540, partial [Clostridia bacterium]|nr:hypothetical protein [Clostridia bacterium]
LSPLWMHMCKSFRAEICLNQLPPETLSYFGKNNEHFRLLMQQDEKFIQKCKDMLLTEFDKEGYNLKDHYRNELVIAAFIRLLIFWYENNCDLPLEELLSLFRELDDYLLEHRGKD